jgi:hypothetical protein
MKQVKIVFHANGENAGTFGPLCFLDRFTGNLEETCQRFVSWDCDIYTTVKRYYVDTVSIPEWMTEQQYLNDHISLKYALALGMPEDFSETQFYNYCKLGEKYRFFIGWLFAKKKLNEFNASIKSQIERWLSDPVPRYGSPLTIAQYEAATRYCPLWEAKQISNSVYWNR